MAAKSTPAHPEAQPQKQSSASMAPPTAPRGNPLIKVARRNLAAHKLRLALTILAVALGTAFVAGSAVFTATLQNTFFNIVGDDPKGLAVHVSPPEALANATNSAAARQEVPLEVLEGIRGLSSVAAANPDFRGPVALADADGKAVQTGGAPSEGFAIFPPAQTVGEPTIIAQGTTPVGPSQIALQDSIAKDNGLSVGDTTTVVTNKNGAQQFTVSGLYTLSTAVGGYVGVGFDPTTAADLFGNGRTTPGISVSAAGVSPEALRDEIKAKYPKLQVQSGREYLQGVRNSIASQLSFINYMLYAFAGIALLVGTFLIFNTFSMMIAQRIRELALLRAIGASRKQVTRSVLAEAVIVGLVGSIIGTVLGIGLAAGIQAVLVSSSGLPGSGLDITATALLAPLVVGVIVTVVSAYIPARRAGAVAPIEAMREGTTTGAGAGRTRTVIGALVVAMALALVIGGSFGDGGRAAAIVGIGAALLILGIVLVLPALSIPLSAIIGRVVGAPFGFAGRLAATNARRSPTRTAATAFSLTLGLALVTAIGMFGASMNATIKKAVDQDITADYLLTPPQGLHMPGNTADLARQAEGVGAVLAMRLAPIEFPKGAERQTVYAAAVDSDPSPFAQVETAAGTIAVGPRELAVKQELAEELSLSVGQSVPLSSALGEESAATVVGIYKDPNSTLGSALIGMDTYSDLVPENQRSLIFAMVLAAPGASLDTLRTSLEDKVGDLLVVQVMTKEQLANSYAALIDQLLSLLYALLALALIISILGIVNTLALSVVERRREIGMLRAVGALRNQVRSIIYLESIQIAIFGALIGIVTGLGLGWAFLSTLESEGITEIAVPWPLLLTVLIGSGLIGVIAAVLPAQRAAKTKPLEAITD